MRKILVGCYAILFSFILFLLLIFDKSLSYANKNACTYSNIILFITGIVMAGCLLIIYIKFIKKHVDMLSTKLCYTILWTGTVLFFVVQLYVFYAVYFQTGWDCGTLEEITNGLVYKNIDINDGFYGYYLSTYPNNVWLVFVQYIIKWVAYHFGVKDLYFSTVVVGIMLVNFSCVLTTINVQKVMGNRHVSLGVYLLSCVYMGLSPWCIIPYSDIYAIFFTTLILYLYVMRKQAKNVYVRTVEICLTAILGYFIKPTVIIVLIAITIVEGLKMLNEFKKKWKMAIALICIFAICFVAGKGFTSLVKNVIGLKPDTNLEYSLYHYAMMGLNDESTGTFLVEDVNYSASFPNQEERKNGNIEVIKTRLSEKGVVGLAKFETKKLLMNYNNGSLAWCGEGNFFNNVFDQGVYGANILKRFYYAEDNADIYNIMHMIWLVIIVLNVVGGWKAVRSKTEDIEVVFLTLIGITLFTLLFEGRARYFILYIPYYIVAAGYGYKLFMERK